MDHVMFLNSSGAIITELRPYPVSRSVIQIYPRITEDPLPIVPYVEEVALPVVSVDSAALFGDHPENLATVSCSSAAALTFYCDSVAGGSDSSGNGSYDDPWRNMRTVSTFLYRHGNTLLGVTPYVQIKVRGDMNYLSGTSWAPFENYGARLILTGWGNSRCDCGDVLLAAWYKSNLRTAAFRGVFSDCTVVGRTGPADLAVDCEFVSGGSCSSVVNCSGDLLRTKVICGGSFVCPEFMETQYAYAPVISTPATTRSYLCALTVSRSGAVVGASITASCFTSGATQGATAEVVGISPGPDVYLADCTVNVTASAVGSRWGVASASALSGYGGAVVSGGTWTASAHASAFGSEGASARAEAYGLPTYVTVSGASATLTASAGAHLTGPDGAEEEYERIVSGGVSKWRSRARFFSDGVVTSSYTSSGGY